MTQIKPEPQLFPKPILCPAPCLPERVNPVKVIAGSALESPSTISLTNIPKPVNSIIKPTSAFRELKTKTLSPSSS